MLGTDELLNTGLQTPMVYALTQFTTSLKSYLQTEDSSTGKWYIFAVEDMGFLFHLHPASSLLGIQ